MLKFADVRSSLLIFVLMSLSVASADTIVLKNGRKISADRTKDTGTKIEYEIGDNTFAIAKTLVDHIDAGGPAASAAAQTKVPDITPSETVHGQDEVAGKIVHDGKVDPEAVMAIEKSGNAEMSAAANLVAGRVEYLLGHREQARAYFEKSLHYQPDNPVIISNYAAVLIQVGRAAEALPYAERGVRLAPESADAYIVLGWAYFSNDKTKAAIDAWKRSLALHHPNPQVEAYIEKAQRELSAEASFSERESGHFVLRYEGSKAGDALGRQIIQTLESHYDDLTRELDVQPKATIPVILYTDQAYFDVTNAPSWSGAVNDGKLRIPVSGVTSVDSELSRVLKHELAHSFINQVTRGRCPVWLNEGVAQAVEPKSSSSYGRQLAQLFASNQEAPYAALEGSWMRFAGGQAVVAYAEGLAAVEYIRDTYGMSDIRRILERIGDGSSAEAALRATIHTGYDQFNDEVGKYLKDKYGE